MAKGSDGGGMKDIIGIALLGLGAYVVYEMLYGQQAPAYTPTLTPVSTPASQSVTAANPTAIATYPALTQGSPPPSNVTGTTTPVSQVNNTIPYNPGTTTSASGMLLSQALQAQVVQAGYPATDALSNDEWNYFYAQMTGNTIPPLTYQQMMQNINSGGPSVVSSETYVQALYSVGLGGLGMPSHLPRRADGVAQPRSGFGHVYVSGAANVGPYPFYPFVVTPMHGLGAIGAGFNVNDPRLRYGNASYYEKANRWHL
jgi:hypothetical protein